MSVAGWFYRVPLFDFNIDKRKFLILIPAHKEDSVIVQVAKEALNQDYPKDKFDVLVIADHLQESTIRELQMLPILLIKLELEESTKVKSLNIALKQYAHNYENVVVLDADNVMEEKFLLKMNSLHAENFVAIQGRRAAKNKSNYLSFLDGLSEEINNHILCKGSNAVGLSAALKGSGMSFEIVSLTENLSQMNSVGGFDKELELLYIQKGVKIKYASNVVVFDEKISKESSFKNQRKRWIASQYFYLSKYFWKGFNHAFRGNISFFNSAVIRNIQLPRLVNIGLALALLLLVSILSVYFPDTNLFTNHWVVCCVLLILGVIFSIPREYWTWKLLTSLIYLPKIFLTMFLLLFNLKNANKKFIHTPHHNND
ncbi:MAG: glycosyltransferase [Cyclobacteriaceae bacterium]|nr:glycosyltransferase [Cyclobacteriaceae bacterium]